MKFSRAKIKEKEINEVLLLKDHFFVDEKKTIEAIRDLPFFLATMRTPN